MFAFHIAYILFFYLFFWINFPFQPASYKKDSYISLSLRLNLKE
ncbi:hypothetical protein HMPREF2532_04872 [Bacteroides ovatus]|nr:hypothetical protein HMPREF2532_04872 [Bacteroides ovatus]